MNGNILMATAEVTGVFAVCAAIYAVIDPSITSIVLAVVAAAVVLIPIWLKYKVDTMVKKLKVHDEEIESQKEKIAEVIKTSDGMKDALVKAVGEAKLAEGIVVGIEKAEIKQAVIATAKAEERDKVKP